MPRVFYIGLLVLTSLLLGHFQERVKINVNSNLSLARSVENYDQLDAVQRRNLVSADAPAYNYYKGHERFEFLYHLNSKRLSQLKWLLTPFFVVIHMFIGVRLILLFDSDKKRGQLLMKLYVICFTLAILIFLAGKLFESDMYPLSRRIVGFLQSILPVGILILYLKLEN